MKKSHIQKLFDNINGGDCVDSAAEAQEITEQLLAALKDFISAGALVKLNVKNANHYSWMVRQSIANGIIAKAEGK